MDLNSSISDKGGDFSWGKRIDPVAAIHGIEHVQTGDGQAVG